MAKKKKKQIKVEGVVINWQTIDEEEYICLTDMARKANAERTEVPILSWLRNRNTVEFLGLWEELNNPNFNPHGFVRIKQEVGLNNFYLSPKKWMQETNAIGIMAKAGRYGGTFAHEDIALEFASWLDARFKLYFITEFKRLKSEEYRRQQLEWDANRFLTKRNYALQTEAVKQNLLPHQSSRELDEEWITYAEEADLLNVALFGMTAKQWRTKHPTEVKKGENIRDHATNIQLIVLSNLEAINSELIREAVSKEERFLRLQQAAVFQLGIFYRDRKMLE